MADHGNNISLAMSNFSNMLKIVSEQGIDDTVMIAKAQDSQVVEEPMIDDYDELPDADIPF